MKTRFSRIAFGIVLASALVTPVPVRAQTDSPPIPPDKQGVAPSTSENLNASGLGRTGQFLGRMVQVPCGPTQPPGVKQQCATSDHYFALQMDGESGLHPLLAGDAKIRDELSNPAFSGQSVRVSGVQYPSTGAIRVSNIEPSSVKQPFTQNGSESDTRTTERTTTVR